MKIDVRLRCSPCDILREGLGHCLFIPLLIAVLSLFCLILFIIITNYDDTDSEDKTYAAALMFSCLLGTIIIVSLIVNSIKESCLKHTWNDWSILPMEREET